MVVVLKQKSLMSCLKMKLLSYFRRMGAAGGRGGDV